MSVDFDEVVADAAVKEVLCTKLRFEWNACTGIAIAIRIILKLAEVGTRRLPLSDIESPDGIDWLPLYG